MIASSLVRKDIGELYRRIGGGVINPPPAVPPIHSDIASARAARRTTSTWATLSASRHRHVGFGRRARRSHRASLAVEAARSISNRRRAARLRREPHQLRATVCSAPEHPRQFYADASRPIIDIGSRQEGFIAAAGSDSWVTPTPCSSLHRPGLPHAAVHFRTGPPKRIIVNGCWAWARPWRA